MKKGMSLVELAQEIERVEKGKRDFVADTSKLWAKQLPTGEIAVEIPTNGDKTDFTLKELAHDQVSARLQIPKAYYDRMRKDAPDLLTTNINAWFQKAPQKRLVRTVDNQVRAFLSDRYNIWADNTLALTASLPVLQQDPMMEYKSMELTEKWLYLQAVLPTMKGEIPAKKGEVVQAGIVISNSDVGFGKFTVERLLYILSCLNGAIRGESIGRRHVGRRISEQEDLNAEGESFYSRQTREADAKAFMLKVRDHVSQAFNELAFNQDLKLLSDATQRKIPSGKIEGTVEEVSSHYGLLDSEKAGFLTRLIEGGDLSQWGVSQAITNLANETESYDRVVELERIGGKVIDLDNSQWATITN